MNCGNCNTPLIPGNNICPNCGAVNMPPSTPTPTASVPSFDFEEITPTTPEVEVPVEITANMAPPSLDVNKEDLESGATDISQANISTYGEEVVETPSEPVNNTNDKVDFDIPSVQKPVENIEMPSDGSAPSIDTGAPTVGEIEENVPTVKIGKKK